MMWPFSTIRNLRRERYNLITQVANWKRAAAEGLDRERAAKASLTGAIKAFDELKQLFDATDGRRKSLDDLRIENAERIQHLANELRALQKAYVDDVGKLQSERNTLKAQLAEALRNDKRDPKTGRFVKVVEPVPNSEMDWL